MKENLFREVNSRPTPSLSPALIGQVYFPSTIFCASRLRYILCVNIVVCQSSTSSTSRATPICAPCYTHRNSTGHHSPTPTLRTERGRYASLRTPVGTEEIIV